MHIDHKIRQYRRDFTARYTCEHCGFSAEGPGYDDEHFHTAVIPDMACPACHKKAGPDSPMSAPDVDPNLTL